MRYCILLMIIMLSACSRQQELFIADSNEIVILKANGRYRIGLNSFGNWIRKGRIFVLKSDFNPSVINDLQILGSQSDTAVRQIIKIQYRHTGLPVREYNVQLSNSIHDTLIFSTSPEITVERASKFTEIMVAIPLPFEQFKYSVSNRYSLLPSDTLYITIDGRGMDLDYSYMDSKAFIKKQQRLYPLFE